MCWALYLASDTALPHVPWNENARGFNTQALSDSERPVASQFSLAQVIYLGSHLGCGCGFMADPEKGDPEELALRAKTVESLSQYLHDALTRGASLEMFLCWEGDQSAPPVARKQLAASDFAAPKFPLGEKEFAVVGA
jgi:hypothetical protein